MKYLLLLLSFVLFSCDGSDNGNVSVEVENNVRNLIGRYEATDSIAYIDEAIGCMLEEGVAVNNVLKADVYRLKGSYEKGMKSSALACQYLYKAIDLYGKESSDVSVEYIVRCYHDICGSHYYQNDSSGMRETIFKIKTYCDSYPHLMSVYYHYKFSETMYYFLLSDNGGVSGSVDSLLSSAYETIGYLEQIPISKRKEMKINSCNIYYNVVAMYYNYFEEKNTDTIFKYLDIVEKSVDLLDTEKDKVKSKMQIYSASASANLYLKQYSRALDDIEQVQDILANVRDNESEFMLRIQDDVYDFYVQYYKMKHNSEMALYYSEKQNYNDHRIYSIDKNRVLNDLRIKYEVESKEADNLYLGKQNRMMQYVVIFSLIVAVVFLIMTVYLIIMRKHNIDMERYEEAVEADVKNDIKTVDEQLLVEKLMIDYPIHRNLFEKIQIARLIEILELAHKPLSILEKRYMICFVAGLSTTDIANMFSVESATVYVVKSRIRKKFSVNVF